LDEQDPAILHDLAHPAAPRTAIGLLVAALQARRATGTPPFTVLSCDNLPENGVTTRRVVMRFAERLDPGLAHFIDRQVDFPNSMVDRIVPATTDDDRTRIAAATGVEDAWPVVCEPFSQWVIEDRFAAGRPAWEQAGAELVDDVRPYETMKLRLLNGSHSSIAYLGQLAGWGTVADAVANAGLASHIDALMREVAVTLRLPAGVDVAAYCRAVMTRFGNSALRHRTAQIAMDGSQKLPQRLFAPALDRVASGLRAPRVALGVAAWLRCLQGQSDDGAQLTVDDPKAAVLTAAARAAIGAGGLRDAIFAMPDIVPPALAGAAAFRADVLTALDRLAKHGVPGHWPQWHNNIKRRKRNVARLNFGWALGVLLAGLIAALPAMAQEPPAPGTSPRIDAIHKAGVLRVGVLANAPWLVENTTGDGDQWSGPAWVLAQDYAKRLGVKLQSVLVSHETKIPVLASNQVDISITALAETPERIPVVDFVLYSNTSVCMFGRADNPRFSAAKTVDDLDQPGVTIAYFIGAAEEGWVKQRFPNAKLLGVANSGATAPLEDIMARRADAAPINRIPYVPMSHKVKGLASLPTANNCQDSTEKAQPVGMAIDKNQPIFLAWLQAVATSIHPRLEKAEQDVIETMK
jgi:polar amino acid transport system substrate-binding protein